LYEVAAQVAIESARAVVSTARIRVIVNQYFFCGMELPPEENRGGS
jgi:hypothetical protein